MKSGIILAVMFTAVTAIMAVRIDRGCRGTGGGEKVWVHDTTQLPPITIHDAPVTQWRTHETVLHDSIPYVVAQIETLLIHERAQDLTACLDSVSRDTFHVCFHYVPPRFDVRIGFAPRVHDTLVTVPVHSEAFSFRTFAVADIDLSSNVFAGVGARAMVFGHAEAYGEVGLQRVPFAATAHVGVRYEF